MRGSRAAGKGWAGWRAGCAILLGLLSAQPAAAQSASPEALKAEVVYRLLMFVTWPADRELAGRPLQLCTVGEGRMDSALQSLAGRPIRHLTVDVRHQARADQLAGCHLLYLPTPQPALRPVLADLPVLVISDVAVMLEQGAMINLQIEDGRIVFDVDLDAARRVGLAISTKLLRLARYVRHQTTSP
ncbi:YfiR family protein [Roseateles sp. P5_E1]